MTTTTPAVGRYDWHAAGLCRECPDLFFPEDGTAVGPARRICMVCPVRERCLADAMAKEDGQPAGFRNGILGGLSPRERAERDRVRTEVPDSGGKSAAARPGGNRPLAACGTKAAHARHRRNGEAIDPACANAWEQYKAGRRKPAACGTDAGYRRHVRERTEICAPCRAEHAAAARRLKSTGSSKAKR